MKIEVKSKKGLSTTLSVIVDKNTIQLKVDERLSELQKEVSLKGFRPGKVPVSVIKNRFGKEVIGEVVRDSVDSATKDTMEKNKLTPSSQPKIEIVSFEEGKDLKAKLLVE